MGLFSTIATIVATAVATKKVGESLIDKKTESKAKTIKEESNVSKDIHKQDIEMLTHKARLSKSQFNADGELVYTKTCPYCGKQDTIDALFCSYCGGAMQEEKISCPKCNKPITKGSRFCNHCGAKM